jgi:hypothetical protein
MNTNKIIKVSEFNPDLHRVVLAYPDTSKFRAFDVQNITCSDHHAFKGVGRYQITVNFGIGQSPCSFCSPDDTITVIDKLIMSAPSYKQAAQKHQEWISETIKKYGACGNTPSLKGIGTSEYKSVNDVPLLKSATIYAIEIIKPDNSIVVYVGNISNPLDIGLFAKVELDYSMTMGYVVAVKNLWTGEIFKPESI